MEMKRLALVAALMAAGTAFAADNQPTAGTSNKGATQAQSTQPAAGAPADTSASTSASADKSAAASAPKAAGDESVRQLQQSLKDKGFDPGPIDGIMGPRTQAALDASKQAEGASASSQTSSSSGMSSSNGYSTHQPSAAAESASQTKQ